MWIGSRPNFEQRSYGRFGQKAMASYPQSARITRGDSARPFDQVKSFKTIGAAVTTNGLPTSSELLRELQLARRQLRCKPLFARLFVISDATKPAMIAGFVRNCVAG